MKQLKSILTDLDNKVITKHQAYDLILVLFGVIGIGYNGLDAVACPKCGSTDIMMLDKGFHEKDKCLECGERF